MTAISQIDKRKAKMRERQQLYLKYHEYLLLSVAVLRPRSFPTTTC